MSRFSCSLCGGVFEKGRSDEEAMAEYAEMFPGDDEEPTDLVCDDCWQDMIGIHPPPGMQQSRVRLTLDDPAEDDNPDVREWLAKVEEIINRHSLDILYGPSPLQAALPEIIAMNKLRQDLRK